MAEPYTIVTGASEGIGQSFARAFAREGRNLILVARSQDNLDTLAAELRAGGRIDVKVVAKDLADKDAADFVYNAAGGVPINCLVNNAGFQVPMGPILENEPDAVRSMIAVNIIAVEELSRRFMPALIATKGTLVNVASHAAFQPVPYMAAYAATKSFVLHFTESLKSELDDSHPTTVHVMALCPGATATNFWKRSNSKVEKTRFSVATPEQVVAQAMKAIRQRRKTVVIPSLGLQMATQALRVSTRGLNLWIAKRLVGH